MNDILSAVLFVGGGFFAFVAGLGVLRFPDLLTRMHAATKASGAALGLVLLAIVVRMPGLEIAIKAAVAFCLTFLTLPVAAHLLGRNASDRSGD
jgi:multicomponent Na+:H+ antiporter subunit G